ncbi:MAG: RagB/SusD family nutrient uptake outer membrane protein [Flammeovirgaceae bacterium]|nr:RagB/SusD family nutrient uptake outer membrane protein [Flammeovirgaceae bacterium]MBE61141.1 RagB/SusD family nutrient uptake outer membrane protein [Flammeovirgaceae bacterium]HCX24808.1 RagB/SusD family nutrient uptake outer membrane protein [Cytophagales bacterium]
MKKYIVQIVLVFTLISLSGCLNDLDVEPIDPNLITSANVYETVDDYKKGLAKLYATFALSGQQGPAGQPDIEGIDEGFGNYLRQYWNCQELTTDEAVLSWNDATIKDFHWHTWTATDVFIAAMYSRIMYSVALCNEYIRATAGNDDPDISKFHAEARFLRALAYYHAIDMFGNPSFVTEEDLPGAFFPEQIQRADLFTYIESELIDIEDDMGDPQFEYGRADKAASWMVLAKLYLNAEVYINTPKYTEAIAVLDKINNSAYSLAPDYMHNFVADNQTSPEMILPITYDGINTQTYGGMVYLLHAQIGGSMPTYDLMGTGEAWAGLRTTSALVNKFDMDNDGRALFWTDGQSLEINDIGLFTDGYAITKFRNRKLDGTPSDSDQPVMVDTDWPMFRLADAYLMYAEAVLRGGTGGSIAQALTYVNALRERAYGDGSGNITSGQLTLDFILDERARELFWEGHRRTDLIRFGVFTGSDYLWPWKGNVKEGASSAGHRDLFPIPSTEIGANPNLKQNTDY